MTVGDLRALYQTARWRRVRRAFLRLHPICAWPGCAARATIVDHIVPRSRGGATWDARNFQPFCKPHHDEKTKREQGRLKARPVDRRQLESPASGVVTRDYSRGVA